MTNGKAEEAELTIAPVEPEEVDNLQSPDDGRDDALTELDQSGVEERFSFLARVCAIGLAEPGHAPGFVAYMHNPRGWEEPHYLRVIYREVNAFFSQCQKSLMHAISVFDIEEWSGAVADLEQAAAYFDELVGDRLEALMQAPADMDPDELSSALEIPVRVVLMDIEAGSIPVAAGSDGKIIDVERLYDQLAALVAKGSRKSGRS